jgi:DNA-binding CsgD family transcriptional regulator
MSLTPREVEILGFVADGNTHPIIAQLLNVSYDTVNFHLDNVRIKLEAKNTVNAVAIAIRANIIS